jgi:hypothetical protein
MSKPRPSTLIGAGLTGAAALVAYAFVLRPWHLRWGATAAELAQPLPGDELCPEPQLNATHALTIHAPVRLVWPWIAQLGQTRGGFYSYTWLENLVGCRMRNADRIVPEWQQINVGDEVWLHPKAPPLKVVAVEPERHLVIGNTWGFYLFPRDAQTTRLIVRGRGKFDMPDLKYPALNFLYWRGIFEPAHFIMERRMLLGIKERAEAAYRQEQAHEVAV